MKTRIEEKIYSKILESPQNIPKFDQNSKRQNVHIFLIDTIYTWSTDKGLQRISLVAPWLHLAFPIIKRRTIKRLVEKLTIQITDDTQLEEFLKRLALKIDSRPFMNSETAFARYYKDDESLEDYVHRVVMLLKTSHSREKLVPSIIEKIVQNEKQHSVLTKVAEIIEPTAKSMSLENLLELVAEIDRCTNIRRNFETNTDDPENSIRVASVTIPPKSPYNEPQRSASNWTGCMAAGCSNVHNLRNKKGYFYKLCGQHWEIKRQQRDRHWLDKNGLRKSSHSSKENSRQKHTRNWRPSAYTTRTGASNTQRSTKRPYATQYHADIQAVSTNALKERSIMTVHEPESGNTGKALLDTGAQVDCLDKTFVQKIGKLSQIERFANKKYAQSFDGKRTEILGVLNLTMKFPHRTYKNINWYVLDLDGKFDGILGAPFFNHHGFNRTLKEQITLVTGQAPLPEKHL